MSRTASAGVLSLFLGLVVGLTCWWVSGFWWYGLMTGAAIAAMSAAPLIVLTRGIR